MTGTEASNAAIPEPYVRRLTRLRDQLAGHDAAALLVTRVNDVTYLTGFSGEDSYLLVTADDFRFLTDFRYAEQVGHECGWATLVLREGPMHKTVVKQLADLNAESVAFEPEDLTVGQLDKLREAVAESEDTNATFVAVASLVRSLRRIKDETEIAKMRDAVAVAEEAFTALQDRIHPGANEHRLAAELEFELRSRGATGESFPSIVATGPSSAMPHYRPRNVVVKQDQPLLFDWGAKLNGYCSDLTRTLLFGKVSQKVKDVYRIVLEAQETAIAALKPGLTTKQADAKARDVIKAAGYEKNFGHGLGHGVGLDVHEGPRVSHLAEPEPLRAGMIITIEPGIYIAGEFGVRIEDDVLITETGCEVLSTLDKTVESCTI